MEESNRMIKKPVTSKMKQVTYVDKCHV